MDLHHILRVQQEVNHAAEAALQSAGRTATHVQRGNKRETCFLAKEDCRRYLAGRHKKFLSSKGFAG